MSTEFPEGPVTILFTDVEGSTDLRTRLGDTAAHQILRQHEDLVRACVEDHAGRAVKSLGDGFMVVFPSVRRALGCAVAIQQAADEEAWRDPGNTVRVRIGLNTGEVVAEDGDLYGQAVNAAARIAARAQPGEILVSEVTRQLAGSGPELTFRDRGRVRLKGFPDRWHLYGLVWQPNDRPELAGAVSGRTSFVGRDVEQTELRQLLDAAIRGSGRLVMIGGEPGVGKTRLADELVTHAQSRDVQVFVGHSYEMEGAPPYVAFVEILETALERASSPHAFCQGLGEEAPEVAKLVPNLRRLCPDIPPPLELPAEQERRMLFNSVRTVVARAAQRRPLLLVLDDLHWADDPTLLLVEHLAERLAELPVLVVATYRDTEVDIGRPLAKTFEDLRRRNLAHRITLHRLPQALVAEMLTALAGQTPPPALVETLYSETEGNPFFVEEVYRYLAEDGRLFDAEGGFRSAVEISEIDVPTSVRLVVGGRLARLQEHAVRVLAAAAVAGRAFSIELLELLDEVDPDALLDIIEEAERARLVVPAPDASGEDRFIFAHELIRQTLVADLSLTRRRRLHGRVAAALEQRYADELDRHAAAIAHHLTEAGTSDRQRLFRFLVMAGRWAIEAAAFEDAAEHLERALALQDSAGVRERAAFFDQLAAARRNSGHLDTAIDAWRQSVNAYEQLDDAEELAAVCVDAANSLTYSFRFLEAAEVCQRGLARLGERVSEHRARLLAVLGMIYGYGGDYESATGVIDQAMAVTEELGDDGVLGHTLHCRCLYQYGWTEHGNVCAAGLRAAELLRSTGDLFNVAAVLPFVLLSLVQQGRLEEGRRLNQEIEPLAERVGHYPSVLLCHRFTAMAHFFETADLNQLERYGKEDLEKTARQGLPWLGQGWAWQGLASFLRGNWELGRERFEEAARFELPGTLNGWETGPLLECLAYVGARSEATRLIDEALNGLPVPGMPIGYGSVHLLVNAVEALIVLGDRERAAALYPSVVGAVRRSESVCGHYYDGRLFERVAGQAAMAGQRWHDAETHFRVALEQAERIPHRVEQAHTRRWYGQMLLDRDEPGDATKASRLLEDAEELYGQMGMLRHQALCHER
jgi:class 3 adenylate cyclase/tetratricopeptide (TPR) repeat protein